MDRENDKDITNLFPPEKYLSFKVDAQIDGRIEKKVEIIRQFRNSFSKKQWILKAIEEKLSLEEKNTENKGQELLKNLIKGQSSKPLNPL